METNQTQTNQPQIDPIEINGDKNAKAGIGNVDTEKLKKSREQKEKAINDNKQINK